MQTSVRKACFQFPECSLSYAKITQGECNSKTGKRSFTRLDTAEPKLILYKDNARRVKRELDHTFPSAKYLIYKDTARRVERGLVLTFPSAVYLIYKDTGKERHNQ